VGKKMDLEVVHIAQGELEANVIKSHLESEGIPVLLKYEAIGRIYGITVDGLGMIRVLVPKKYAEEAKRIIEPQAVDKLDNGESGP
jgi:hypothetical protein